LTISEIVSFTEAFPGPTLPPDLITGAGSRRLRSPKLNIRGFFCNCGTQDYCALLSFKPANYNLEEAVIISGCETEEGSPSAETLAWDTVKVGPFCGTLYLLHFSVDVIILFSHFIQGGRFIDELYVHVSEHGQFPCPTPSFNDRKWGNVPTGGKSVAFWRHEFVF
jgi:hypothetical protein